MVRSPDRLFLLRPDFTDPAYPGRRFYCWHCALLEGVLASFPDLASAVDVVRVAWPRPRREVVDLVGEAHQSLPLLVLAEPHRAASASVLHDGLTLLFGKDAILAYLADRYGCPEPHP